MNSGKIKLRALTQEDAKTTWIWRNSEKVRYFYAGHPFFINPEKEESWMAKILGSDIPMTSFGIEETKTNLLVGMSFLRDINLINRTAEFSIFIGEEQAYGKGYATEAVHKTLHFAFSSLNLNRVYLKVQQDNFSAIALYKKCNFKEEGILREAVYKNGQYINDIVMSILKKEYVQL